MRAVVLVTYTDCENKWRSLQAAGHDVHVIQYDNRGHDRHHELIGEIEREKPDFVVFIGAVEIYHGKPVPVSDVLCRIRKIAPFVHMCNDAGDPPWWPMLEEYHARECFDVQVNIDGALETPIANFAEGMTLLTPIDTRVFHPRPWAERKATACLVGGHGHGARGAAIDELRRRGVLEFYEGKAETRPYAEMADIMCHHKYVFCHPMTGSGQRTHVKGRVVECGFAGAALIELGDSPTSSWFRGGEFFSAKDFDYVEQVVRADCGERTAERLNQAVNECHTPRVFWKKVLTKAADQRWKAWRS